jgi:hypothetical protein
MRQRKVSNKLILFSLNKSCKTITSYFYTGQLVLIAVFTRQNNARCISVFLCISCESDLTLFFSRGAFIKSYSYSYSLVIIFQEFRPLPLPARMLNLWRLRWWGYLN